MSLTVMDSCSLPINLWDEEQAMNLVFYLKVYTYILESYSFNRLVLPFKQITMISMCLLVPGREGNVTSMQ